MIKTLILSLIFTTTTFLAVSQKRDSLKIDIADTAISEGAINFYARTEKFARKSKLTKRLFNLVISEPAPNYGIDNGYIKDMFEPYRNKTISRIDIKVLSPFGINVVNDTLENSNYINRLGNNLHIKTQNYIVSNNLLFKEGFLVDPINIAETEVFLRNSGFIQDARIRIDSIPQSDQVIVTVMVRDVWSIGVNIDNLSGSGASGALFDKNFLGTGSTVKLGMIFSTNYDKKTGPTVGFGYNNIFKSFVNAYAEYKDKITEKYVNVKVERELRHAFSVYGKAQYDGQKIMLKYTPWDSVSPVYNGSAYAALGYALKPFKHSETQRLTFAASYTASFPSYSGVIFDPELLPFQYTRSRTIIGQVNLFNNKFYRKYLVHNFGTTENIAYGYLLSAQLGYSSWPDFKRKGIYSSLSFSGSQEFVWGNLYIHSDIGSYYDELPYESVFHAETKYISPLIRLGKNKIRSFINVNYTKKLNPINGFVNYVYFSELSSVNTSKFNNMARGVERLMLTAENDLFSAISIFGFRFVFYNFADIGWFGNRDNLFNNNNLFWGAGLGIRVRNEMLVFNTLELKIGYYPKFDQNMSDYLYFSATPPTYTKNFTPDYPKVIPL